MTTAVPVDVPQASFAHLLALTDSIGTFEHADHTVPRRKHGYCTDDMARVLIVATREPNPSRAVQELGRTAMRFLVGAQGVVGTTRNRRSTDGRWHGRYGVEDCWGRSVAAFGIAGSEGTDSWTRQMGAAMFGTAVEQRSPHRRAMTFAALGAAAMLETDPDNYDARSLLVDAIDTIGPIGTDPRWPWPEDRLTYANATLPEALIAAGQALERAEIVERGVHLLVWLLDHETLDGHLSPTPVGGAGPADRPPRFDQQSIEVAAIADACARAERVTGDRSWSQGVDLAVRWFIGDNDAGATMWDPSTGGGYDGLHDFGPNLNQGAESTIALISTLQHAHQRTASP